MPFARHDAVTLLRCAFSAKMRTQPHARANPLHTYTSTNNPRTCEVLTHNRRFPVPLTTHEQNSNPPAPTCNNPKAPAPPLPTTLETLSATTSNIFVIPTKIKLTLNPQSITELNKSIHKNTSPHPTPLSAAPLKTPISSSPSPPTAVSVVLGKHVPYRDRQDSSQANLSTRVFQTHKMLCFFVRRPSLFRVLLSPSLPPFSPHALITPSSAPPSLPPLAFLGVYLSC